jgi:hypothetical protein
MNHECGFANEYCDVTISSHSPLQPAAACFSLFSAWCLSPSPTSKPQQQKGFEQSFVFFLIKMVRMYHLLTLLLITVGSPVVYSFQFMKGWKVPTYDPKEEATKTKFGDKSACCLLFGFCCCWLLVVHCYTQSTLTSCVVVAYLYLPFVQNWSSLPVPARVLVARQPWPCCEPGTTMWSEPCESTYYKKQLFLLIACLIDGPIDRNPCSQHCYCQNLVPQLPTPLTSVVS